MASPASVVDRSWIVRTQEARGFKAGAVSIVADSPGMTTVLDRSVVTERRTHAQCERSFIVHGQTGLRDDVDDSAKTIPVFSRKASGHDIGGLYDVGA